jgi:diguanylate cyclase (GGDEF)-like protein
LSNTPSSLINSLGTLTKNLYSVDSLDSMMDILSQEMERLFGFSAVWLYKYVDTRKATIQLVSAAGKQSTKIKNNISSVDISNDKLCKDTFNSVTPIYIKEASLDPRTNKDIVKKMGNRSLIQSQLFLHGESIGSLGAGSYNDEEIAPLTEDEVVYFGAVSNAVSITVDRMEYKAKSLFDSLTGLQNKRSFTLNAERLLNSAKVQAQQLAVIFFDLDNFKPVNDYYGHNFGDEVLRLFAVRLDHSLRREDLKARVGGDEFIVILPGITEIDSIIKVIDKIRNECGNTIKITGTETTIEFSAGYSLFPTDGCDIKTLTALADKRMYLNKEERRITKKR